MAYITVVCSTAAMAAESKSCTDTTRTRKKCKSKLAKSKLAALFTQTEEGRVAAGIAG